MCFPTMPYWVFASMLLAERGKVGLPFPECSVTGDFAKMQVDDHDDDAWQPTRAYAPLCWEWERCYEGLDRRQMGRAQTFEPVWTTQTPPLGADANQRQDPCLQQGVHLHNLHKQA